MLMLSRDNVAISEMGNHSPQTGNLAKAKKIPDVLQKLGTPIDFNRGAMLFLEGDTAKYYYQVLSGTVKEYAITLDGYCQIIDFHFEDDLFGAADNDGHPCSAQAVTKCSVLRYPKRDLEELAAENKEVSDLLMDSILRKLKGAIWQSITLGQRSATARLWTFLTLLAERIGRRNENMWMVELTMRRQDIAEYLGLTIETVSRQISRLKEEGKIISVSGRKILMRRDPAMYERGLTSNQAATGSLGHDAKSATPY